MGKGGHKYSGLCRGVLLLCWVGLRMENERPRRGRGDQPRPGELSISGSHIEGASRPAPGTHPLCPQTWASGHLMCHLQTGWPRDFPSGPVVKNPPCKPGDVGSISGQGTGIPHATGQLSPRAATRESTHHNETSTSHLRIKILRLDTAK